MECVDKLLCCFFLFCQENTRLTHSSSHCSGFRGVIQTINNKEFVYLLVGGGRACLLYILGYYDMGIHVLLCNIKFAQFHHILKVSQIADFGVLLCFSE